MNSILIRKSYYSGIKGLSPENRLAVYDAIMHSAFEDTPPDMAALSPAALSPAALSVASLINEDIQSNYAVYVQRRGGSDK